MVMKKQMKINHLRMKQMTTLLLNAPSVEILASIVVKFVENLCAIYFVLFLTPGLTLKVTEFSSMEILDALLNSWNVIRVGKHLLSLTNSKSIC